MLKQWFNRRKTDGFLQISIKPLLDHNASMGCVVSDKITKEGWKVGYFYRESPLAGKPDSGWRFLAGDEDDAYMENADNHHIFALNTICNYDPDIIPHLDAPVGTCLIRVSDHAFAPDDQTQAIFLQKQNR